MAAPRKVHRNAAVITAAGEHNNAIRTIAAAAAAAARIYVMKWRHALSYSVSLILVMRLPDLYAAAFNEHARH